MQRCVGLPDVGRPAGDAFRRRAARARPQILKVLEGQNMVIRVGMVIRMVILYGYGVLKGPQ